MFALKSIPPLWMYPRVRSTRIPLLLPAPVSLWPGGQVPFSPCLLGQALFQTATTAFMSHIRLPRPCRVEKGSLLHDPFVKTLVLLHSSVGPNCLFLTQNRCLVQTLAVQRPRLTLFKASQLEVGGKFPCRHSTVAWRWWQ